MEINEFCTASCFVEDGVVKCRNIGNEFTETIAGFPVDRDDRGSEFFYLYDSVIDAWPSDFSFDDWKNGEETILTPWLESMGITVVRWKMGEVDSFGPLSRVAVLRIGVHRGEFIYG